MEESAEAIDGPNPHATLFRLALQALVVYFKSDGIYICDKFWSTWDNKTIQTTLTKTVKNPDLRKELGLSRLVWESLAEALDAAVPTLRHRCFSIDKADSDTESPSSQTIVANAKLLVKDIRILINLVSIARNILACGAAAQNLAAEALVDQAVLKVISVDVSVTTQGFEGKTGSQDEQEFQKVVDEYKELLYTCLQFLNNLMIQNEQRKLMLWLDLFDMSFDRGLSDEDRLTREKLLRINPPSIPRHIPPEPVKLTSSSPWDSRNGSAFVVFLATNTPKIRERLIDEGKPAGPREITEMCMSEWRALSEIEMLSWCTTYHTVLVNYIVCEKPKPSKDGTVIRESRTLSDLLYLAEKCDDGRVLEMQLPGDMDSNTAAEPRQEKFVGGYEGLSRAWFGEMVRNSWGSKPMHQTAPTEGDCRTGYDAREGAEMLRRGKADLMSRLNPQSEEGVLHDDRHLQTETEEDEQSVSSPVADYDSSSIKAVVSDDDSDGDRSDDDDYPISGEEGRGLLTGVPLVLDPAEITVLPMIVLNGIVPPKRNEGCPDCANEELWDELIENLYTVRCNIFLGQPNGRNLMRELLIFVAAWDCREEDLYYKFMVRIVEAILKRGLLVYAYQTLKEKKDLISPAQAVIMKLLTTVFRSRQLTEEAAAEGNVEMPKQPSVYPSQVDVFVVGRMMEEFRSEIIPQVCSLIFLQGQIKAGLASPDEFPMNQWDMERMYEGLYQFMEFFAILTEHKFWQKMMADWELVSEFITLLKELDRAIPLGKYRPAPKDSRPDTDSGAQAVAVERPYDVSQEAGPGEQPPVDPNYAPVTPTEPADFEWKNLKKLAVLVLSSLVYKCRPVQDQIREFDGIEPILSCCRPDEHNPYIREHAVVCLRFLMEQNPRNLEVVHRLQAQNIPTEILEKHGWEKYQDGNTTTLRKKPGAKPQGQPSGSQTQTQPGASQGPARASPPTASASDHGQSATQSGSTQGGAPRTNTKPKGK
ncbi:hypothetical protein P152DRAFT_476589 [Eremomyces bilateralis CBS 781.70]|uniref:Ataxin-10 homolog n=1 Tax=Eremomyces bilateralis CBS 781.70 TaxID=1392243 RepID=A0A6G1FU66_9PEZI|nr:uncharacterized protein P152DRAFT_476589 [Eremomyces bilateralis CBS 781.70]KAF1809232.1 hypothetical protein P152DRAFT_476589 [Eremomyces bilateralis CBS 781.70]